MTQVQTNLRNTRERARQLRFEPVGAVTQTNVQKAIEQVSASSASQAITPTGVNVSPYAVLVTDTVLYVDTAGGPITINLATGSSRGGIPLTVKDITGHAAANPITIVPNGGETIDGQANYPIGNDFGGVRLYPRINSYTVAP